MKSQMLLAAVAVTLYGAAVTALDNGAALTPPLGWLSWQRYRCAIACNDATSPDCFNEKLIRDTADEMVAGGYLAAGYNYLNLDDCWQAPSRENGHLVADPHRFPSGMKSLAAYVHSKGLKFGIYTAMGNGTCASHKYATEPLGLSCDYTVIPNCAVAKQDIEDMVSWDIDHLKVDGCYGFDNVDQNNSYALVGQYLQQAAAKRGTGPVVYHPSNLGFRYPRQFHELASIGNQWRWFNDVQDSWESVLGIIEEIGAGQPNCIPGPLPSECTSFDGGGDKNTACAQYCVERDSFLSVPQPGGWHDPDMLLTGNTDCSAAGKAAGMHCNSVTHDEEKTQLAIWAMASAPLLMSNDLKAVPAASKDLLLNTELLAIDQDRLGRMCFRYANDNSTGLQLWRKQLAGGDMAVAAINVGESALSDVTIDLRDVGFAPDTHVQVRDVFAKSSHGWVTGSFPISGGIPSHGAALYRLSFVPKYST